MGSAFIRPIDIHSWEELVTECYRIESSYTDMLRDAKGGKPFTQIGILRWRMMYSQWLTLQHLLVQALQKDWSAHKEILTNEIIETICKSKRNMDIIMKRGRHESLNTILEEPLLDQ